MSMEVISREMTGDVCGTEMVDYAVSAAIIACALRESGAQSGIPPFICGYDVRHHVARE